MPIIEWSDDFSVNIKEIDEQHRESIDIYNAIVTAKEDKKEQELMNNVRELNEHWKMHFKYEEDLMEQQEYSGIASHRKEHEEITNNTANLEKMYSYGFKYVLSCLTPHLQFWIDEHIKHVNSEDKKLGEYLNSKGVT